MQCKISYKRIRIVLIIILINFNILAVAQDSWIEGGSRRGTLPGDYDQDGRIHIAEIILAIDLYLHPSSESEYLDFNANGNAPESQELQLVLDAFLELDLDLDGMADAWETVNGLNTTLDDAAEDPDSDDLVNSAEYNHKTDPLTQNSNIIGIAERFQALLNIPNSSEVIISGPVEPGTIIRQESAENDTTGIVTEIQVPDTAGTYYVFMIDDEPLKGFFHPMRYAWMEISTEAYDVIDAEYRGVILRPGIDPSPFNPLETFLIEGVPYTFMQGEGQPVPVDVSHKPAVDPFSIERMFWTDTGHSGGLLKAMDPIDPTMPRKPFKLGLMLDCGDIEMDEKTAERFYLDAFATADWLENDYGFIVQHISQYWENRLPYLKETPEMNRAEAFINIIETYGGFFSYFQPSATGKCDEFFLYVKGHGARGMFMIYEADGSYNWYCCKWYKILQAIYDTFPVWVKVTIFFDSCHSEKAISENQPIIEKIEHKLCSLTILTTCSDDETIYIGRSEKYDGGTQGFHKGSEVDVDEDGTKGDIQDRWHVMKDNLKKKQGVTAKKSNSHKIWCSTDGPNAASGCEEAKLHYLEGNNYKYLLQPSLTPYLNDKMSQAPVLGPDPNMPAKPRTGGPTTSHVIGGLRVKLTQEQFDKLRTDFPCPEEPEEPDPDDDEGGCPWGSGGGVRKNMADAETDLLVFFNVMESNIPLDDPVNYYRYGFAFNRDTIPDNNFIPPPEKANHFFKDADFWITADYSPSAGWSIERKTGDLQTTQSNSKIIIAANTLILFIPRSEFYSEIIRYRCTAFRHTGDLGVGGDWDGDVQPPVADGLYWMYIGSD